MAHKGVSPLSFLLSKMLNHVPKEGADRLTYLRLRQLRLVLVRCSRSLRSLDDETNASSVRRQEMGIKHVPAM